MIRSDPVTGDSLTSHALSIGKAGLSGFDAMVDVELAAMSMDPQWDYFLRYRMEYPKDLHVASHVKDTRGCSGMSDTSRPWSSSYRAWRTLRLAKWPLSQCGSYRPRSKQDRAWREFSSVSDHEG